MRIINPSIKGLESLEAAFIISLLEKPSKVICQDYATFAKILFHSKINEKAKIRGSF